MNSNLESIVLKTFKKGDHISTPLIQRKCKVGYNSAKEVFDKLVDAGIVKRPHNKSGVSIRLK